MITVCWEMQSNYKKCDLGFIVESIVKRRKCSLTIFALHRELGLALVRFSALLNIPSAEQILQV